MSLRTDKAKCLLMIKMSRPYYMLLEGARLDHTREDTAVPHPELPWHTNSETELLRGR